MNCLSILTTLRSIKTALKILMKTPVFWIKGLRNQIPKRLKLVFCWKRFIGVGEWDKNDYYLLLATLKTTICKF
ncbi:hypothetical protein C2R82_03660 [Helicobacter pylori]|nr:hypothetical protein C2R82_03660 [Helicobacter pylori]